MNIVRYEVIHRPEWLLMMCHFKLDFCPFFCSLFMYKEKKKSYILLLKSDATVLALPSIDRQ